MRPTHGGTAKFEYDDLHRGHTDEQLLDDLRRVARELGAESVTMAEYRERGKYTDNTVARRFKTWNGALRAAGLRVTKRYDVPDEELFRNLAAVWNTLGRQPHREEMRKPLSEFNGYTYEYRFNGWGNALRSFVAAMNAAGDGSTGAKGPIPSPPRRSSPQAPGWRVRFLVMRRDRFRCCACGMSPSTHPETRLVIDHIVPRSKGGTTAMENLHTLCEPCNGGKSDLLWESE